MEALGSGNKAVSPSSRGDEDVMRPGAASGWGAPRRDFCRDGPPAHTTRLAFGLVLSLLNCQCHGTRQALPRR